MKARYVHYEALAYSRIDSGSETMPATFERHPFRSFYNLVKVTTLRGKAISMAQQLKIQQ
jgi:hypothetical protein